MKKIIAIIGFSLALGLVCVFWQILGEVTKDRAKPSSKYERGTSREIYLSETIITIPWGEKEDQIRGPLIPATFAVSPDGGFIYVPDFYKRRIMVFNSTGELVRQIKSVLSDDDRMGATINDIMIDYENNIYLVGFPSLTTTHIRKIGPNGRKIFEIDVPHDIDGKRIIIAGDILFYGNITKNMAVYDTREDRQLEQAVFDGVKTNSYFVDVKNNLVQNERKSKNLIDDINLDSNAQIERVLGEDKHKNLYFQYGTYLLNITPDSDYNFCVRKFNRMGEIIAQVDLRKIYDSELVGRRSHYTRIVNIDTEGNIYQLYADFDNGMQIVKYSPTK